MGRGSRIGVLPVGLVCLLGAAAVAAEMARSSLDHDIASRVASLEATVARLATAADCAADARGAVAVAVAAAEARFEARLSLILAEVINRPSSLSAEPPFFSGRVDDNEHGGQHHLRALLTGPRRDYRRTTITTRGVSAQLINAVNLNVTGDMHIEGQLYWHGHPVGFQPPTPSPTPTPTPDPTAQPTLKPSPHPTHEPTTNVERVALVQNGYALVGRAYGPGTVWHPCSSNWASTSTFNADKCGTCTNDMKHALWSTLSSNQLMVCFGPGQTQCAPFTHNKNKPLRQLYADDTFVTTTEAYTFNSLKAALGVAPAFPAGGQWCGINLAFGTNGACNPVNPNSLTCGGNGNILRVGCIGDGTATGTAGCNGGPDDYALGVGVTSCYDGATESCTSIGCSAPSLHWRGTSSTLLSSFSNTAYFWVKL